MRTKIRRQVSAMSNFDAMIKDMGQGVVEFFENFNDDPTRMPGYGHNYFCEDCGGRLIFKLDSPKAHVCPVCGIVYTTDKFNTTWVYLYRIEAIHEMLKSAYLYKVTKEPRYLDYAKEALTYYASNYLNFPMQKHGVLRDYPHDGGSGSARIMSQGLNEAMAFVKILLTLDVLADENALEADFLQFIKDNMITHAVEGLFFHQVTEIHNIKCWMLCAVGMAGVFFNEEKWTRFAFESEYNIRRQLAEGVTDDDFWYEGSIHYNYFTTEGIISLVYFCRKYGFDFGEGVDIPRRMLLASYDYAFDNGMLPSPNDSWPNTNLKTYVFQYYAALDAYDDPALEAAIADINALAIERQTLPLWDPYHFNGIPLEALRRAPVVSDSKPPKRKSVLYPASNFAFLRNNRLNLFMKYGHNGPSHAHPDKMTFDLMVDDVVITRDLANSGYSSKICSEWHRMTAAHNTVAVDGGSHTNTQLGEILAFSENEVKARATVQDGVVFTRGFKISSSEIHDEFCVEGDVEHTWDYFLHIDGDMACDGTRTPAGLGYDTNGYQHIINVEKIDGAIVFDVSVEGVRCQVSVLCGCDEIFLCDTPDNPAARHRKTLVLRKRGKNAAFKLAWKLL